jgi:lysophospholipase L1-like esterase
MTKPALLTALLPWLCVPVLFLLGQKVRARTVRMVPPPGPITGKINGKGETLRLLVIGDSSAAGVGANHTSECLGPVIAENLNRATGQPVEWRMAGSNSAIASELRDHVIPHLPHENWTHILFTVGTNDAKNFVTARGFTKGFGGLIYALKAKFPDARLVWSPIIDMEKMPTLTPFLARMLNIRARLLNAIGTDLCRERYAIAADPLPISIGDGFAADGFHANGKAYKVWADHVMKWLNPPFIESKL